MTPQNSLSALDWLNIISFVLSALGLVIAAIQTAKAKEAKEALKREKRNRSASIWHNIALVLNAYETLEDARDYAKQLSGDSRMEALLAKLSSARRCTVDQYLDLLKSAVLDEEKFDQSTIDLWVKQGKLQNEWRVLQAKKFLNEEKV